MQIGDKVKILPPFDVHFPGEFVVEAIKEDGTCVIMSDRDFDPKFLEKVI